MKKYINKILVLKYIYNKYLFKYLNLYIIASNDEEKSNKNKRISSD